MLNMEKDLKTNLKIHGIPDDILEYELDYEDFLEIRRSNMANLIKDYFKSLTNN